MDVGVAGVVVAVTSLDVAQAIAAPNSDPMRADTYAELLNLIPVPLLIAADAPHSAKTRRSACCNLS
jgi:hypothetical protein